MYAAIIFSHSLSSRLQYVVDFIAAYYGASFKLVSSEVLYASSDINCKINYGYHPIAGGEIFVHSHALLFETAIRPVKVQCFTKETYKAFFQTEGDVGFDIFAAIFYLLSRYEEYLPHKTDAFGRYAHQNSVAFKEGFLHQPLINIWLEDFRRLLAEKNAVFASRFTSFKFIPTYDIDLAWSFKHKGFKRNAGGLLKLLITGRWRLLQQRIRVLRNKTPDPFDAYSFLNELHLQHQLKPVYFFLVSVKRSRYDKNIDVNNKAFLQLMQDTAMQYTVGLHPSWASGDAPHLLKMEKHVLEAAARCKVTLSRQHYIRFRLPETFRHLLAQGITNDYSMGYGSINGFRASVATPFYWYNLKEEKATTLLLHPFCFMDANAYYEQQLSASEALQELNQYYAAVKAVNGQMVTIFHNNFLGSQSGFEAWQNAYRQFLGVVSISQEANSQV